MLSCAESSQAGLNWVKQSWAWVKLSQAESSWVKLSQKKGKKMWMKKSYIFLNRPEKKRGYDGFIIFHKCTRIGSRDWHTWYWSKNVYYNYSICIVLTNNILYDSTAYTSGTKKKEECNRSKVTLKDNFDFIKADLLW